MFGSHGQQIVNTYIYGLQQVGGHASVAAVGSDERRQRHQSCHERHHHEGEHDVAQPLLLGRIAVFVAASAPSQARDDVLHDAQRTDDGAVDASEDEREHDECQHHQYVQRQHGRQKLYLGRPSEPEAQRAREVEKHQRYEHIEHRREYYSCLSQHR